MNHQSLLQLYSPYDTRFADPSYRFDLLEYARAESPIWRSDAHGGYWVVSSYTLVAQVLQDVATFRSGEGVTVPHNPQQPLMPPIDSDPPAHRAWRRLLNPYLSPSALVPRRPEMQQIARDLVGTFVDRDRFDIMADYAEPLSALILAQVILGVDDVEEIRDVQRNNHAISAGMDSESAQRAFVFLREHAQQLVNERTRHPRPDDIVSAIVGGPIDGKPISEQEAVSCLMILYLGGLDTVSDAIGSISYRLARDPTLIDRVRDQQWFRVQVDEFLRLDSPVSGLARTASRDTELGGQAIAKGDQVLVLYLSANRDEAAFCGADRLDFDRGRSNHVAFGLGPHRCVGSHLARIELDVAFSELLARVDVLHLANDDPIVWKTGLSFGPRSLPVRSERPAPSL
jgi:cytochrome P450